MSNKVTVTEFTRHPRSVFVTPASLPDAAKEAPDFLQSWGSAARVAAKGIVASAPSITPAIETHQSVQPHDTPEVSVTSDSRKEFVAGAADNMRVYRISHLGAENKLVYEASPSKDETAIFERAQAYADRSGYLVRIVRHHPHLIESFRPAVWREVPDAPPVVDSEAPRREKLSGLGFHDHRCDSAMFFDDRVQSNGRWKRRNRDNVIAWLNSSRFTGHFDLNIVRKDLLCLLKPIPRSVSDLGDAIDWVCYHAEWRCADAK